MKPFARFAPALSAPRELAPDVDGADVVLAQAGDLDAFDRLVARHERRVYALCLWVIGDADEAGDAAQDAFIRAWRYISKFRGDCAFGSWLSRIAINVARDAAKKRGKAPRDFSSLETPEGTEFDPVSTGPAPGDSLLQRERQNAVRVALAKVPEHFRVVLILFDLQGRSYEECAATLQLPMGTVKSRLSRARAALREALGDDRELFGA